MIHETESTGHVQKDGVVTSVKSDLISLKLQRNRSKITNLSSLKLQWSRPKTSPSVEQIEDGESYLHVTAMEQTLATSLISLR
ncbi:Tenascin-R [Gossypium arboreum]|uniref:Tenascin-R n=1 Tax=Gossypium arboreum TaxID=29729 RepID=A0A0B0PBN5_GOSAR|nr:Tenascin-R [Gossypium arboreum]